MTHDDGYPRSADKLVQWQQRLKYTAEQLPDELSLDVAGRLTRMVGLTLEAEGFHASLGSRCQIIQGKQISEAEVVGFHHDKLYLMPVADVQGLAPNARVLPLSQAAQVSVGYELLGRVIDGAGYPLDGDPLPSLSYSVPLNGRRINPLIVTPSAVR